jgi:hypothetical protein
MHGASVSQEIQFEMRTFSVFFGEYSLAGGAAT